MARRRTTQTTDDQTTETTGAPAGTDAANADAPAPAPARRGRRPRTDTATNSATGEAATAETAVGTGVVPAVAAAAIEEPQKRRQQRRRRSTIDTATEARLLIAAVLRQRGAAGASQDELQQVVSWGRSTRAESQQLQRGTGQNGSGSRTRRPSEEALARAQRSALNTLLLERVLLLDVRNEQLVFRRQELDSLNGLNGNG